MPLHAPTALAVLLGTRIASTISPSGTRLGGLDCGAAQRAWQGSGEASGLSARGSPRSTRAPRQPGAQPGQAHQAAHLVHHAQARRRLLSAQPAAPGPPTWYTMRRPLSASLTCASLKAST